MTIEAGVSLESRRTLKKPKLGVLDEALWTWFCQERQKGIPILGPIIKGKALILIRKIGRLNEEFTASEDGQRDGRSDTVYIK
jgi:hypothetical protein